MKCLNVRKNNIGADGIQSLCKAMAMHKDFLSVDFRDNPGTAQVQLSKDNDMHTLLRLNFLKNIRKGVTNFEKTG